MKKILILPLILSAILLSGCSDTNSLAPTNSAIPSTSTKAAVPTVVPSTKTPVSENTTNPNVKKSNTGICHAKETTYYGRTLNFTAYDSIDDCLASGGRLPKK